jgi:hypothetical protein
VANFDESIQVGGTDESFSLVVPERIPVGTTPTVTVRRGETPVANATVTVSSRNETWTTADDGTVRIAFLDAGRYEIEATTENSRTRTTVEVGEGYRREFVATISVSPDRPSIATRPRAVATLKNPWEQSVTRNVTLVQNDHLAERNLTLRPGKTERLEQRLPYRPAGRYTVTLLQDGRNTTTATYRVQGDERLAAALASSGRRSSGGGIAQAVELVFGNIRVLVGTLVVLVGVMTVGATTASFARSIHAARDEIGIRRAVGASPVTIYKLTLGDALRIGSVSALLAVGLGGALVQTLLTLGELRLFGVALRPTFSPELLLAAAGSALVLALVSVAVATVSLVSKSPAMLLAPIDRRAPTRSPSDTVDSGREVRSDD